MLGILRVNIGKTLLVLSSLKFLKALMCRIECALDLSSREELKTKLNQPYIDCLDNNLHNTHIWRSYPPRLDAINSRTNEIGGASNLNLSLLAGEENERLNVGGFLGWVGDHVFALLGNEQLLVDLVPLAERIIQVQVHPQCRSSHSRVSNPLTQI